MLFYEDLLKKLEESSLGKEAVKKVEKFNLGTTKMISGYGIAIPLVLIGLLQVYSYTLYHKWYLLIVGVIIFGLGLFHLKKIITYSIIIDTEKARIKSQKLDLMIENIKTITLKEMKVGKKIVPVIDIITLDKKQVIIPLFMSKQIRFINVMQILTADKFSIVK